MEVLFIVGNSKSGKTTCCLEKAIDLQKNNETSIVIVPEQSTLSTEKKLVTYSEHGTILHAQVYSFQRLAFKIFQEIGIGDKIYLEDIGKLMLLRLIIEQNKNNLVFYNKGVNKVGFIEEICNTISEFYQYEIKESQLESLVSNSDINKILKLKLTDLMLIYKKYDEYIKSKYISTDDTLDILSERIKDSKYIKTAHIFIDGFSGLTPQEYAISSKLISLAKSVTITFQIDEKTDKALNLGRNDPFFDPKRMKDTFSEILLGYGLNTHKTVYLKSIKKDNEELDFLKENFFRKNIKFTSEVNNIKIFEYKDKYEEVEATAKNIIKLVKDENYKFSQIYIVAGNITTYKSIIKGIFNVYKIPVFIDEKNDILNQSLTIVIRGIIEVFVSNFNYESIFKILKTELFAIDIEEIEIFENYVLEYGIKGYKWNFEQWKYGEKKERYNVEKINELKKQIQQSFGFFTDGLKKDKKYTVTVLAQRIFSFLLGNKIYDKLEELKETSLDNGENQTSKEYSQIWKKYVELFDKIVDILGDVPVTVKEFGEILDSGIKACDLGLIPAYQDEVIFGNITRSKLAGSRATFIIGANDGVIPSKPTQNNIISDSERGMLESNNIKLAPNSIDAYLKEQLPIYDILMSCSDKIFITYAAANVDGSKLKPSMIINKFVNLYDKLNVESDDEFYITFSKPYFSKFINILKAESKNEQLTDVQLALIEYYNNNPDYSHDISMLKEIINGKNSIEILPETTLQKLYGSEIVTSISKLERYAKCPYSYFLEYNLKIQERKLYELASIDLGNLFHEILEAFTKITNQLKIGWDELTQGQINEIVDEIISQMVLDEENNIFESSYRYKYYLVRATEIAKKSIYALSLHIKNGDFKIAGAEVGFGLKDGLTAITVNIGEEKILKLTGKVDRIDIMDKNGNKYIKILDYKSGNKKFSLDEVYSGVQLQLLTYLNAIIENGKNIFGENVEYNYLPGGVFYFNIQNPKFDEVDIKKKENYEKALLSKFKLSGILVNDKNVINGLHKNFEKGSDIIPVYLDKEGNVSEKKSSTLSYELFDKLMLEVRKNIEKIGKDIFGGNISANPLKSGKEDSCKYCNYSSICEIELKK